MTSAANKAAMLFAAVLAFALSPLVVPPFQGWDPAVFPVAIDRHPIQPAGYAFSLWGLIYLSLVAHGVFGLLKRADDPVWDRPRTALTFASLIGAVWMPIANLSPVWGVVTIWPLAIGAIIAFVQASPARDRWLLSTPIALLAGWLTAASSVATGVLLAGQGVLPPIPAAGILLTLSLLIGVLVQLRQPGQPVYGLALIWALVAIVVVNRNGPQLVAILAGLAILAMAVTLVIAHRRARA